MKLNAFISLLPVFIQLKFVDEPLTVIVPDTVFSNVNASRLVNPETEFVPSPETFSEVTFGKVIFIIVVILS